MVGLITDISANSLKIHWPPKAVETMVQRDLVFRPKLKRGLPAGARLSDGFQIQFGARLAPANNQAQILDGGNFPIPKDATDRQFVFKSTIFTADFQIGGMTLNVANSDVAAFNGGENKRRPVETMDDFGKDIERVYVGTAGDGIRGYVESEPSANHIKIKNPWGTRLVDVNMLLSERVSAGGAVRDSIDGRTIVDVDHDTRIIEYSGADQTPVADDPLYIVAETAQTLSGLFANGLRGQVDDGTNAQFIHTLDRTASGNRKLKSPVDSTGSARRPLTESLLVQIAGKTARGSMKRPSTLFMGEGQSLKYVEFLMPQRRLPQEGSARFGKATGYTIPELAFNSPYGRMDFMQSFDALPGEIYGLSWDCMFFYSKLDAQWMAGNELGNLLMLPGSNGAAFRFAFGAHLVSIENWGTDYPPGHFVIRDLTDHLLGD